MESLMFVDKFEDVYKLDRSIGRGSYGSVRLARFKDDVDKKWKACKIVPREGSYLKELDASVHLNGCFGIMTADRVVFTNTHMLMEFPMGTADLYQYSRSYKMNLRTTLTRAVSILQQLLVSVVQMHDRGIIHRDLKSGNVVVWEKAGEAQPWVIDLGMSTRISGSTVEDSTEVTDYELVTCTHRAPELWTKDVRWVYDEYDDEDERDAVINSIKRRPRTYNHKVDEWAVGCILYEMVAYKAPFRGSDEVTVRERLAGYLYYVTGNSNTDFCNEPIQPLDIFQALDMHVTQLMSPSAVGESVRNTKTSEKAVQSSIREKLKRVVAVEQLMDEDCAVLYGSIKSVLRKLLNPNPTERWSAKNILLTFSHNKKFLRSPARRSDQTPLRKASLSGTVMEEVTGIMSVLLTKRGRIYAPSVTYLAIFMWLKALFISGQRRFSALLLFSACMRISAGFHSVSDSHVDVITKEIARVSYSHMRETKTHGKDAKRDHECVDAVIDILRGAVYVPNPTDIRAKVSAKWCIPHDDFIMEEIVQHLAWNGTFPFVDEVAARVRARMQSVSPLGSRTNGGTCTDSNARLFLKAK